MTDREAKWVTLEYLRASLRVAFTHECLAQVMAGEASPLMPGDMFWFAGIQFKVVGLDVSEQRSHIITTRCGGRPFTEEEAMTGHFRMSAV